jgi:hypothetical protein
MNLGEILEFLTSVKRTPIGQLDETSELAQRLDITRHGKEIGMPAKRACVELAARLQGYLRNPAKPNPRSPNSELASPLGQGPILTHEEHLRLIAAKRRSILRRQAERAKIEAARQAGPPNLEATGPVKPVRSKWRFTGRSGCIVSL